MQNTATIKQQSIRLTTCFHISLQLQIIYLCSNYFVMMMSVDPGVPRSIHLQNKKIITRKRKETNNNKDERVDNEDEPLLIVTVVVVHLGVSRIL